jgi:hypothetical protein
LVDARSLSNRMETQFRNELLSLLTDSPVHDNLMIVLTNLSSDANISIDFLDDNAGRRLKRKSVPDVEIGSDPSSYKDYLGKSWADAFGFDDESQHHEWDALRYLDDDYYSQV